MYGNKKRRKIGVFWCFGGDKGIRTPGLRIANATLYQLSHTPTDKNIIIPKNAECNKKLLKRGEYFLQSGECHAIMNLNDILRIIYTVGVFILRYCHLRQKQVINLIDGARLGCISDLILDECSGKICAIAVPMPCNSFLGVFYTKQIVIPFGNIVKFGDDTVLVEVDVSLCETVK